MNEGTTQTVEIDLKDLFCYIFKHATALLIAAVIFGIAGVGFSYVKQTKESNAPVASILDTTVKQPGESDEAYYNRVANVERANAIMDNIAVLTKQVEIQNDYLSDSVYMQIDPLNTATTKIQVVITCDSDVVGGLEALYNAYSNDVLKGDYIIQAANALDYTPGSTQELISCNLTTSGFEYANSSNQMGVMNISVYGKTIEDTELIADAILSEIELKSDSFSSLITPHSISVIGRISSIGYDSTVRQKQLDSVTTLNTIQTQINNMNNNLDSIAKSLGLENHMDFYESQISAGNSVSVKSCMKYGAFGVLLGMALVIGIYTLFYLSGRTIVSQMQFFMLFKGITRIGVCRPLGKRTKIATLLDRCSNDDNAISEENTKLIISANVDNLTADLKKLLITGTSNNDYVKETIKKLGIEGDVVLDVISNPSVLARVSEYDGVILVEQRGVSKKKLIAEQIRLLGISGKRIVGAIIL